MKKATPILFIGIFIASVFFIRYEIGRAGDIPQTPAGAAPAETPQQTPQQPTSETTPVSVQVLKGSGKYLSIEPKETGEFVLTVQDELEAQRTYLIPKGLIIQKEEAEIQPGELQKGDILDIDYSLSEEGQRRVTHVDVVIPVTEKEMHVDSPAP